jgi:hypothetical protein
LLLNQEILQTVKENIAEVTPRSMNLSASSIPVTHGLVQESWEEQPMVPLPFQTNRF